jgi:hypothetical protein
MRTLARPWRRLRSLPLASAESILFRRIAIPFRPQSQSAIVSFPQVWFQRQVFAVLIRFARLKRPACAQSCAARRGAPGRRSRRGPKPAASATPTPHRPPGDAERRVEACAPVSRSWRAVPRPWTNSSAILTHRLSSRIPHPIGVPPRFRQAPPPAHIKAPPCLPVPSAPRHDIFTGPGRRTPRNPAASVSVQSPRRSRPLGSGSWSAARACSRSQRGCPEGSRVSKGRL